jgi:transposase
MFTPSARRNAGCSEPASLVASFANGVIKDKAAINAAITASWSNGQTEGQITKLKLVKCQMHGRASSICCKLA